ncbi:MAG: bifunctional oligoribonuclease/PAP phosphatase NrnA [Candidatus Zixiibacteriota bacterium]
MENNSNSLEKILDFIRKSHAVLITSHRDPDGDSIGSQLTLAELAESLGKRCRVINQGNLPDKYRFLDPYGKMERLDGSREQKSTERALDLVFVLDCTSLDRLGQVSEILPAGATLVNIDHHPDNEQFGTFNYIDVEASAVGEMVFSLWRHSTLPLTPTVATQLFAAILTDTGRFKFSNTSPHCLRVCAELVEAGANPKQVTNQIYFNHSLAFLKLLGSVLSDSLILLEGKICAITVRRDLLSRLEVDSGEMEGVVDYSLFLKGVEIGLLFTEKEECKTKVNLRSQNHLDVSKVARVFGGGGHRNAAGCTLNHDLEQSKKIIIDLVEKILKNERIGSSGS